MSKIAIHIKFDSFKVHSVNDNIMLHNSFREKCELKSGQSFAEYMVALKMVQNTCMIDFSIQNPAYMSYFKLVTENPEFLKKNLHELFEVDAWHQQMYYELHTSRTSYWINEQITR